MNKLKLLLCGILLVCTSVVFVACGDKDFKTEDVKLGQNEFVYDGNFHIYDITYKDTKISALYSLDGEKFTEKDKLAIINAGTYKVYFKISAKGFKDYTGSHNVVIKKATINADNLTFGATSFQYDGTKKMFDVGYGDEQVEVKYSLDAGASKTYVSKDQINVVDAGTYTVFFSVSSQNFETYYGQKTMVIADKTIEAQDVTVVGAQDGKVTYTYTGSKQIFDVTVEGIENATVVYSLDAGETKNWVSKADFPVLGTDASNNDKPHTVFFKVSATNYADYIGSVVVSVQQIQFVPEDFRITTSGTYTGSAQSFDIQYVGTKIAQPEILIRYALYDGASAFNPETDWSDSTTGLNIVNAGEYTVYYYVIDRSTKKLHAPYGVKELSATTLADAKSFTFTVNKANLADFGAIEATNTPLVYNGAVRLPNVTFKANDGVTVEPTIMFATTEGGTYYTRTDAISNEAFANFKNAGNYTVYTKAVVGDSSNYTEIKQTINFTIEKSSNYGEIDTVGSKEIEYNGKVRFPTITIVNKTTNATLMYATNENGTYYTMEDAITSQDFASFSEVGEHTVYVKAVPADTANYNEIKETITYKIIKATPDGSMVQIGTTEFTYNGKEQMPQISAKESYKGATFTFALSHLDVTSTEWKNMSELKLDFVNAGESKTIWYRVTSKNYNDMISSFNFVINKANINVAVDDIYQFEGEAKVEPTSKITSGEILSVDAGKVSISLDVKGYDAGATAGKTFDINASLSGEGASNYNLVANAGTYYVVGLEFNTVANKMTEIMNTVYNNETLLGKETYYSFAQINEKLTAASLSVLEGYYMEVAAANADNNQVVVVNGVTYYKDSNFELSIGNANYIVDKAFIIENGKMKMACPVIAAMIENIETTQLTNIKVFAANDGITVAKVESASNPNEYNLTITSGKTMLFITIDGVTLTADDMFISKKVKNGNTTFGSSKTDPYNVNGETGYAVAVYPIGWVEDITTIENKTFDFEYTVTLPNKGVIKCLFHITINNGTAGETTGK